MCGADHCACTPRAAPGPRSSASDARSRRQVAGDSPEERRWQPGAKGFRLHQLLGALRGRTLRKPGRLRHQLCQCRRRWRGLSPPVQGLVPARAALRRRHGHGRRFRFPGPS